ncbi:MAG: hypothetical protein OEY97_00045 [Nitrospirota bacterium]|nr:hypothetical protein [Nitrospirota bacterium]
MPDITHIHPMLVHFPISLFLIAVLVQIATLVQQGDLAADDCLPQVALGALVIGTVAAIAAGVFGDIALEHAAELGFPEHELEEHEELGFATVWFFVVLTSFTLFARFRGIALDGGKGWGVAAAGVAGVVLLVMAAAHGGELVYELGVNVEAVTP